MNKGREETLANQKIVRMSFEYRPKRRETRALQHFVGGGGSRDTDTSGFEAII